MLSVAVLTPAQASLVAVQLLDAAHMSGAVDGQPLDGTRLGAVTFTPTGLVDVGRLHADDGPRVVDLLRQLLRNAHRLPTHPRHEQLLLLHRLEEATREPLHEPDIRARELEGAMAETLGSGARARLTGELAALVDAFAHLTPSEPAPTTASSNAGSSRALLRRGAPGGGAPGRRTPRRRTLFNRRRRGRLALLVLVVVAALAVGGYFFLRGPGAKYNPFAGNDHKAAAAGHHTSSQHGQKSAHKPQPHHPRAVPALAARHAGPITGVAVQKVRPCQLGSACPVKVTVHFHPVSSARTVGWRVGVARTCTHHITWSAPTTVTTQAGWTSTWAHSAVHVPKGHRFALFAMTSKPARAQSPPVPVAGSSLRC